MCNVGTVDRIIRAVVGIGLIVWGVVAGIWWLDVIGVIALGTALMSFCPLYTLIGFNTGCKKD